MSHGGHERNGFAHIMFRALFRKPLQLRIGDQTLVFDSSEDFEFALDGRCDVPGAHVGTLMSAASERLREEAAELQREEQRLTRLFADTTAQPEVVEARFQTFRSELIRSDHDWQDILRELAQAPARYVELKRTAMMRYLQYLNTRARFIDDIVSTREDALSPDAPQPARETITEPPHELNAVAPALRARMHALSPGERTRVLAPEDSHVSLMLASNPVDILRTPELRLDYDATESWPLPAGRTLVGRSERCEVVLHRLLKDISREHAVIDVDGDAAVWVTDLSSHGTYLVITDSDTPE